MRTLYPSAPLLSPSPFLDADGVNPDGDVAVGATLEAFLEEVSELLEVLAEPHNPAGFARVEHRARLQQLVNLV